MKHVMLDLETLSSEPNAAIIQIGAIAFDTDNLGRHYYVNVNFEDAMRFGRASASTIRWWMQQSDPARRSMTEPEGLPLITALSGFNEYLAGYPDAEIWSHATFDIPVIMSAYSATGVERGLKYKKCRDLRTLELFYDKYVTWSDREGVHHDALEDAVYQAKHAQKMLRIAEVMAAATTELRIK